MVVVWVSTRSVSTVEVLWWPAGNEESIQVTRVCNCARSLVATHSHACADAHACTRGQRTGKQGAATCAHAHKLVNSSCTSAVADVADTHARSQTGRLEAREDSALQIAPRRALSSYVVVFAATVQPGRGCADDVTRA
eukprot:4030847-Pleurochrysis_carterae.AAC.2